MYLGIDLGTSAVKIVVIDAAQTIKASASQPIATLKPRSDWSEQDPYDWVKAVFAGLDRLAAEVPQVMAGVRGIGLSGQMHAALLLDEADRPVAPAILWNDSRAVCEARELADGHRALCETAGVLPMPGFTGPKLLWLARNRPDILSGARRLLFPKDYVRLALTGERATDISDAAGSWLLDQTTGEWSSRAVDACRVQADLPRILRSHDVAGRLRCDLARRWHIDDTVELVAGAADVPAGCLGVGVVGDGQGLVSLGTSAQVLVAGTSFSPEVDRLVHSFAHAMPGVWYNMAAMLTGASALDQVARWTGYGSIASMLSDVEQNYEGPGDLLALPYLVGERTPHNDTHVRGAFIGMSTGSERGDFARAMMEAVAFSLRDGLEALGHAVRLPDRLALIGGGSGSAFWAQMISSILNVELVVGDSSGRGPAFGAARLAMIGAGRHPPDEVLQAPPILRRFTPDRDLRERYDARFERFRSLYKVLAPEFRQLAKLDSSPAR